MPSLHANDCEQIVNRDASGVLCQLAGVVQLRFNKSFSIMMVKLAHGERTSRNMMLLCNGLV